MGHHPRPPPYRPCPRILKPMPAQDARVKVTILDCYEVTEETERQRFSSLHYKPGDHSNVLIAELKEYATCWLKLGTPGEKAIEDKTVLEQVFLALLPAIKAWLMCSRPMTLTQAAAYLENYFTIERAIVRPEGLVPKCGTSKPRPKKTPEETPKSLRTTNLCPQHNKLHE